jgi:hypothetical protein
MRGIHRKISWIMLSVLAVIAVIAYFCPVAIYGSPRDMAVSGHPCPSLQSMADAMSCTELHLAAVGQFLGIVPHIKDMLVASFVFAVAGLLSVRMFLEARNSAVFRAWRYTYRRYRIAIKWRIDKRFLRHFRFLGNGLVASIA